MTTSGIINELVQLFMRRAGIRVKEGPSVVAQMSPIINARMEELEYRLLRLGAELSVDCSAAEWTQQIFSRILREGGDGNDQNLQPQVGEVRETQAEAETTEPAADSGAGADLPRDGEQLAGVPSSAGEGLQQATEKDGSDRVVLPSKRRSTGHQRNAGKPGVLSGD